jgi:DHA1 family bicyclomycin/chloramphenicol resistance-like MFS transporter
LTGVTPLSIDMALPALPALAISLDSDFSQAQLMVGVFLTGFAFSQLLAGPISDRYGRRLTLIVGLTAYLILSILCAIAPNLETLLVFRFLQGVSACAAPVSARAMVADIYDGPGIQRAMSIVTAGMGFAPILAPSIGAFVLEFTDWRGIFWTLAGSGALMLTLVTLFLSETRPVSEIPPSLNVKSLAKRYQTIGTNHQFLRYALPSLFAGGALFTFLSSATFTLQNDLGASTREFGFMFAGVMLGFVFGATLSGKFSPRLGLEKSILIGIIASTAGGWLMALAWLANLNHWGGVIVPMACVMFGMGILRPNSIAGAIAPFRQMAGAASALIGFLQMSAGATAGLFLLLLPFPPSDLMPPLIALYPTLSLISFLAMRMR